MDLNQVNPKINVSFRAKWPFLLVLDACYRSTGWALLNGPIVTYSQQNQFAQLRRAGFRLAGMSSYLTFPRLEDGGPLDYESLCEVWCHCFRDPERFLTAALPRALISVSDFTDYGRISPEAFPQADSIERFDFVYVGAMDQWKRNTKNWKVAGACVPLICRELGLRCLVIGAPTADFPPSPRVEFSPPLPWRILLSRLAGARFLFLPNELDASPRLLAEALCLNVPLVVNRNILGGWKYVNRFTGSFFEGEGDVLAAVRACLTQAVAPRDWFRANHGPYQAGKRLLRLLKSVDPGISERSHLWLADRCEETAPGQLC